MTTRSRVVLSELPNLPRAACKGMPTDLFVGPNASPTRAKQVCEGCPDRRACLAWAVPRPDLYGIWGGLTTEERAAMRRHPGRSRP